MRPAIIAVVAFSISLTGCAEDRLGPSDLVGLYPFAQIDRHNAGWYHQIGGENCGVAFMAGSLRINDDGTFRLELSYDYRCLEGNGSDGASTLLVTGQRMTGTSRILVLTGCGPPVGFPEVCPEWGIEVTPSLPMVTLKILGDAGRYWAYPVITMGPRQQ